MKKLLSIAFAILLIASMAAPAFAHGSHRSRAVRYTVCSVQGCTLTGIHSHSGRAYAAHYYGDGHEYHAYCELEDCTLNGYHAHDGVYCFGHTAYDGHGYHHTGRGHH